MIPRSHARLSTAALLRYLIAATGVGSVITVALGTAACGGKVFVDPDGVGGSGGSGGSSSSGVMPFTCDVATTFSLEYFCLTSATPQTGCPAASKVSLDEAMTILGEQGCGGAEVASIPCGPDPAQGTQCCYFADAIVYECGGRPFLVEGGARTADPAPRADWSARLMPATDGLSIEARRALAEAWTKSALDEHASIASFARFTLDLLAVGAPASIVADAQRAMGDEIRHAEACFAIASAYAGADVGPSAIAMSGAIHGPVTLADVAAATVREGCVGEAIAAFIAAASRDEASDPAVREALARIVAEEQEHAALAFRFVVWALNTGDGAVRDAVAEAFRGAMSNVHRAAEDASGDDRLEGELRAHGRLSRATQRALTAQCVAEVIAPLARAVLDVGRASQRAGEALFA